jgi:hypothetical protein
MGQDETKYECPVCHCDMTEQVNLECKIIVDIPMMVREGKTRKKGTPESVSLQCPKEHWAEYSCSQVNGDVS